MAEKTELKNPECERAKAFMQQFIAVHGHGAITRYANRRLNGVSLARIIRALELGTVKNASKISGSLIDCTVEYEEDDNGEIIVTVIIYASIHHLPPVLVINRVEERKETRSGKDHAA